jgi:hypothetical protein
MNMQFDAKTEAVIEKVRKLLALASSNPNEAEAESAASKAMELLAAYNLDLAHVDAKSSNAKAAARDKRKMNGGLYSWQRNLWDATARLNFCKYWYYKGLGKGTSYEHELLGSKVNVLSSQLMAQYLQDTVERLAREWVRDNRPGKSIFIKEAIAYREGITDRLVGRMWDLRHQRLREDEARRKADREANAERGIFTENALVLADVISTEEDLNNDHINGYPPGTSAKERKEREARQAIAEKEAAKAMAEQEAWDLAHPEDAARRKAKERAEYDARMNKYYEKLKKARPRKPTPEEERRALGSFSEGYEKGDEVSLDRQIDEDKRRLT